MVAEDSVREHLSQLDVWKSEQVPEGAEGGNQCHLEASCFFEMP